MPDLRLLAEWHRTYAAEAPEAAHLHDEWADDLDRLADAAGVPAYAPADIVEVPA